MKFDIEVDEVPLTVTINIIQDYLTWILLAPISFLIPFVMSGLKAGAIGLTIWLCLSLAFWVVGMAILRHRIKKARDAENNSTFRQNK
jgi:4-hydroxybenzoate polyprenyltransferase